VLVQCNANELAGSILDEDSALLIIAVLEKLLAEVVSEWIGHQLNDMLVSLKPDHMHLLRIAVLELLLQVSAAVLILAQGIDFSSKLFERHVGESVHGWEALAESHRVWTNLVARLRSIMCQEQFQQWNVLCQEVQVKNFHVRIREHDIA